MDTVLTLNADVVVYGCNVIAMEVKVQSHRPCLTSSGVTSSKPASYGVLPTTEPHLARVLAGMQLHTVERLILRLSQAAKSRDARCHAMPPAHGKYNMLQHAPGLMMNQQRTRVRLSPWVSSSDVGSMLIILHTKKHSVARLPGTTPKKSRIMCLCSGHLHISVTVTLAAARC